MQEENPISSINFNNESINIREEIEKYLYHWKWFVIGVVIAVSLAFFYLRYTANQYEVSTTILIDDKDNGGLASELSAFEDLGLIGNTKTSLDNEMELLKSRSLLERVVKDLGINVTYFIQGRVIESEMFTNSVPFKINFFTKDYKFYNLDTLFKIKILSSTNFVFEDVNGDYNTVYDFGENIITKMGDIVITPRDIDKMDVGDEITVKINSLRNVVDLYRSKIQIQPANKNSSVIKLTLKDPVKLKAQAILDNLVYQYNKDAVEDKSVIAKNTNKFINKRLEIITKELSAVDKGVEVFKTKNKLTDVASEASLILQTNADLESKILDVTTQLRLVDFMNEYITESNEELIPANLGLTDASISESILKYNELFLERNRILKSSSKLNPVIINLQDQLIQLHGGIAQSLDNLKSSLTISLNTLKGQENRINAKISAVPRQEKEYRDIQRQQQIMESLYLYLLQKREENAISLAVTLPNAKIIDKAYGSNAPVEPKRRIVYLAALLLGMVVPFTSIYLLFLFDNKVHTRKDVEAVVKAPILGEIPRTKSEHKVVVTDSDRSSTAESFRLLRTNVNFMLSRVKKNTKTIFVTSTIATEGKTFIAINLASVLALSNKKVLLIGADIRKPKIAEYLNIPKSVKGLSHFLMDNNLKVSEVIEHVKKYNFDILESGIMAPNPSELLMNGRFDEILAYGKENYDYVIVDTAPTYVVTDTLLLGHHADLFIYVVRADYLDKRMLDFPKTMYENKRLPNMSILINNTDSEKGYGYGYGYGYNESVSKKPWWKKMWS